jgi:hypothetical protein
MAFIGYFFFRGLPHLEYEKKRALFVPRFLAQSALIATAIAPGFPGFKI